MRSVIQIKEGYLFVYDRRSQSISVVLKTVPEELLQREVTDQLTTGLTCGPLTFVQVMQTLARLAGRRANFRDVDHNVQTVEFVDLPVHV